MTETKRARNTILIAEDDPVSRRMLKAILMKWGYHVVAAETGVEALRILESEDAPPLAILDWMMPGMEGTEVCQRVRQLTNRPYTYIVLLTARTRQGDLLRGLDSGADGYLTKPFDAEELRARLQVGERILDLHDRLVAARDELRFRATHDALTGIGNRAVAIDALQRECARQVRERGSVGVILMDLDHFKHINDTYGHLCGDAVLKEVAQRVGSCVRAYDTVGRYGGEEFLVVVASSDALGPAGLAERIREAIASAPIMTTDGPVRVTASFGVATSGADTPLDAQVLLSLADQALYRAKDRGRNRCEIAEPAEIAETGSHSAVPARIISKSD